MIICWFRALAMSNHSLRLWLNVRIFFFLVKKKNLNFIIILFKMVLSIVLKLNPVWLVGRSRAGIESN
jgi:hypothetical protein